MTDSKQNIDVQPLVSIGMPTYNRPDCLRLALEGIVNQTYRNLEIIVSDNASPGGHTEEVVREFMQTDTRIQYHRQPENLGFVFNYQFVLDQSTGEYFMWAADDDWRDSDFVKSLLEKMIACPSSAIGFCDFIALDSNGNKYPGYPDFFYLLKPFETPIRWLRLWRYFMQKESLGKANIVHGLLKRKNLEGYNGSRFAAEQGNVSFGNDMLIAFWMLSLGPLALSNKKLYGCTVGNVKEYNDSSKEDDLKYILSVMQYSLRYIALSDGVARLMIVISLPLKLLKNLVMLRSKVLNVVKSTLFSKEQKNL